MGLKQVIRREVKATLPKKGALRKKAIKVFEERQRRREVEKQRQREFRKELARQRMKLARVSAAKRARQQALREQGLVEKRIRIGKGKKARTKKVIRLAKPQTSTKLQTARTATKGLQPGQFAGGFDSVFGTPRKKKKIPPLI